MTVNVNDIEIIVPRPEAYILHKLVINEQRNSDYKKEKDIVAVQNVFEAIKKGTQGSSYIQKIYNTLTKKQQAQIQNTCKKNNIDLQIPKELKRSIGRS